MVYEIVHVLVLLDSNKFFPIHNSITRGPKNKLCLAHATASANFLKYRAGSEDVKMAKRFLPRPTLSSFNRALNKFSQSS